jgi:hypothetical protein
MTVLEIIQEAAKRLCIIVPRTIVLSDIQSKEYDADTGLLLSCLNACIKQIMTMNVFNQNIVFKSISKSTEMWQSVINFYEGNFCDFSVNMQKACPDFEELMGDGFVFSTNGKSYLFRKLTHNDFLRLCKRESRYTDDNDKNIPDEDKVILNYLKNMPSDEITQIKKSDNLESGFYIYTINPDFRIIYFCNNMIDFETAHPYIDVNKFNLSFTYRSNYGVISADGEKRQPAVLPNNDFQRTILPDELAILGTMIKYKSYYGMDFSLDLGEQKALVDALKQNQEGIQVTHLNKKEYFKRS